MRHRCRPQRPLPLAADPQNGTVGEKSLHTHSAETFGHAEAPI